MALVRAPVGYASSVHAKDAITLELDETAWNCGGHCLGVEVALELETI